MKSSIHFRGVVIIMILASAIAGVSACSGQEHESTIDQTAVFMRAKLASSQKVIEGLVTENYQRIGKAAAEMKQMSAASQWPTADDKSYEFHQEAFRRQCDQLAKFAETKNLPGAHYTYLQLTTTCINCHDYVRRAFSVRREDPKGPVMLIPNEWEGSNERHKVPAKEAAHIVPRSIKKNN